MKLLETKLPPLLVLVMGMLLVWSLSPETATRLKGGPLFRPVLAAALFAGGILLTVSALRSFRRFRTSVDPMDPEKAKRFVTSGVYAFSRNPMYLAMLLVLASFVVLTWQASGILVLVAFIAYITRFQIIPEERVLAAKFGDEFTRYCERVRRWL